MALLLRASPTEGMLRSVGDEPLGIVGIGNPSSGVHGLYVDGNIQVPKVKPDEPAGSVTLLLAAHQERAEHITFIDLDEAVAGCEGELEIQLIYTYGLGAIDAASTIAKARPGALEDVRSAAEFAIEVRDKTHAEILRRRAEAADA